MNSYCPNCPVSASLIKCSCSNPGMGAFCVSLAAGNSSYTDIIIEASRAGVATIEDLTAFMESRNSAASRDVSESPGHIATDMDINRAIVRCPHRVKPVCGCPDNPHTCTHPDRAGEKWWLDCYQCKVAEIRTG